MKSFVMQSVCACIFLICNLPGPVTQNFGSSRSYAHCTQVFGGILLIKLPKTVYTCIKRGYMFCSYKVHHGQFVQWTGEHFTKNTIVTHNLRKWVSYVAKGTTVCVCLYLLSLHVYWTTKLLASSVT